MLYFFCSSWLAFFWSALCCFWRGKSTSTRTRFFFAYSENSGLEKTSLLSLIHQPHQSEPVKSSMTSLFSALALAWALERSVIHCRSSAPALKRAKAATSPNASFFIIYLSFYSRRKLDAGEFTLFNPHFFARDYGGHSFAFERPAVKRAVQRFACSSAFVKHPIAVWIQDRHIAVGT